jgi:DNA-binding CsgD family transcriptional regulator
VRRKEQTAATTLTKRELEVLGLLAEGRSRAEIVELLVISPKTVSTHIERILIKLGVHSVAQAVAVAYRRRIVPADTAGTDRRWSPGGRAGGRRAPLRQWDEADAGSKGRP